jgi:putative ABC transport system substrate-binding protein
MRCTQSTRHKDHVPIRTAICNLFGLLGSIFERKCIYRLCLAITLILALPGHMSGQSNSSNMPRIGVLSFSSCEGSNWKGNFAPFLRGLSELGYILDKTITIECRSARKRYENISSAAAELVRLPVDVIVANSQPEGQAASEATDTIPIVTIISGDPVAGGLANSIAKPGGNVTGISYYATELTAKRLELLKELMPQISKVGVLANPNLSYLPFEEDTKRAAIRLGIAATTYHVSAPDELKNAINQMKSENIQAIFVLPDLMLASASPLIAKLALEQKLPTMAWGSWFTQLGCLMSYSSDYRAMNHRLAFYVDRILKGANPGDLPIEQPTTFTLSVNLKTAAALGVDVPQSILLLADEVVE